MAQNQVLSASYRIDQVIDDLVTTRVSALDPQADIKTRIGRSESVRLSEAREPAAMLRIEAGMKRPWRRLIAICLCIFSLSAYSAAAQPSSVWRTYRNQSGTSVPFPANLFTVRAGEGTPRGEVFSSADGRARMHVFAFLNERYESPAQFIARVIVDDRRRLTYQRITREFFVFSAPENDRILYRRCNFANDRMIHCVDLRYPRAEKRAWDGIVTRMSLGLGPR